MNEFNPSVQACLYDKLYDRQDIFVGNYINLD